MFSIFGKAIQGKTLQTRFGNNPFEFQIKRQSGDYRWISLIGEPINENGNM